MKKKFFITERLHQLSIENPNQIIYSILDNGEEVGESITYSQLYKRVSIIASCLQKTIQPGHRAILLFNPGIEYITALFGCFYAGVIAVPAFTPRIRQGVLNRTSLRIRSILNDATPAVLLTTSKLFENFDLLEDQLPEFKSIHKIVIDKLNFDALSNFAKVDITSGSIAYLQYTSGSTSDPKGVMVTHENLYYQSRILIDSLGYDEQSISLIWLPPFHDWGLIEGIILPVYSNHHCFLMDSTTFVQQPLRWLNGISQLRVTHSGGPNFALNLCVRSFEKEQRLDLDLSCWKKLMIGAEPIRPETLENFAEKYKPYGFKREAITPAFGLAEATLQISCSTGQLGPKYYICDNEELAQGNIVRSEDLNKSTKIAGCGGASQETRLMIVDPETRKACADGKVGEIWALSKTICKGYWNRPEETEQTFQAYISDTQEGPFLRTGDLGFMHEGEIYFTGRLKDLIIVDGLNHYPQDIEITAEKCCDSLSPGLGAAFSLEKDSTEGAGLVYEIKRTAMKQLDTDEIVRSIRRAVSEEHGITLHSLVLIRPGSILKTSSGKIQRSACRRAYLEKTLNTVFEWNTASSDQESTQLIDQSQIEGFEQWLNNYIAQKTGISEADMDYGISFMDLGFSSRDLLVLAGDIERKLGVPFTVTTFFDYPNIQALIQYLTSCCPARAKKVSRIKKTEDGQIAVIGMSCRFPGAQDISSFWNLLNKGMDAVQEIPEDRWNYKEYFDLNEDASGKTYTKTGGFIQNVDLFDAPHFRISRAEAIDMDPQQRLLLEVCWEAFEDAGYAPDTLNGTQAGVFIGICNSDYFRMQMTDMDKIGTYAVSGNSLSIAAGRLSYTFGLKGPSLAVDTACSSSLMAVHMAKQSLLNGECNIAAAGGVNLILSPDITIALSKAKMLSFSGKCSTFDDSADGYVRSEGCGIVILKKLADAVKDNDPILAVIKGSAVNQDGSTNGITAPSKQSQVDVVRNALYDAGIAPYEMDYLEAHGTGTKLGDPIEITALAETVAKNRNQNNPLYIGSVKTNIGHLESAAGIAGLIKVVLSLKNKQIPAHLHVNQLNTLIPWDKLSIKIPDRTMVWEKKNRSRTAGVSSFGFSGTNVHLILEEYKETAQSACISEKPYHILTLSASCVNSLFFLVEQYRNFLENNPEVSLKDFCYTANQCRAQLTYRNAVIGKTREDILKGLDQLIKSPDYNPVVKTVHKKSNKLAFVFTGQGDVYQGVARELYQTEPEFKNIIDLCFKHMMKTYDTHYHLLVSSFYNDGPLNLDLEDTSLVQPLIFMVQYGLVELYKSWDICPSIVMGHSIGEYAAACTSGVMDWMDALDLIIERGRLVQNKCKRGKMAAVFTDEAVLKELVLPFGPALSIAVYNAENNLVISGEEKEVQELLSILTDKKIEYRELKVSNGFHSHLMDPVLDDFTNAAKKYTYHQGNIALISNVTGLPWQNNQHPDAAYWTDHLRLPVRFDLGARYLIEEGCSLLVEIGTSATLTGIIDYSYHDSNILCKPSIKKGLDNNQTIFEVIKSLYKSGHPLNWNALEFPDKGTKIRIPHYPFKKERYWNRAVESVQKGQPVNNILAAEFNDFTEVNKSDQVLSAMNENFIHWDKLNTMEPTERAGIIEDYLVDKVSAILMAHPDDIDTDQMVSLFGFDSLMALRLRNQIQSELKCQVPVIQLLGNKTIKDITDYINTHFNLNSSLTIPGISRTDNFFALSSSQRQLWYLQRMDPKTAAYCIPSGLWIKGTLQIDLLEKAINELIKRHEILRAVIQEKNDSPGLAVLPLEQCLVHLPVIDLSLLNAEQAEKEAWNIIDNEIQIPIDLEKAPLMRPSIFKTGKENFFLLLVFHHIVADGWSLNNVLVPELKTIYSDLVQDCPVSLPALPIQYIDFTSWQTERMTDDYLGPHLIYWKNKFNNAAFEPLIAADFSRKSVSSHLGERLLFCFPKSILTSLHKISKSCGATLFALLMTGFKILLYRWTGKNDLTIGTTIASREIKELESLIGEFTNHLPLRSVLSPDQTFAQLLGEEKENILEAFSHGECPFDKIVEAVNPARQGTMNPLFNISFVLHSFNNPISSFTFGPSLEAGFMAPLAQIDNHTSELDLIIELMETDQGLIIECEYDKELYQSFTINQLMHSYEILLDALSENIDSNIMDIPIVTKADEKRILKEWNKMDVVYQPRYCLHQLFEQQCLKTPKAIAVKCENISLTYEKLNNKANELAGILLNQGTSPGSLIGIYTERSIEMVIAILGILKAGCAYIALDPAYPVDHVLYVLKDSAAKMVVAQKSTASQFPADSSVQTIVIDALKIPDLKDCQPVEVEINPSAAAYVLYTSGSTGKPKGAIITHYNVVRLFEATQHWYQFDEKDVWTLFHSYAFDFSVWELWGALIYGGKLIIVPYLITRTPELFYELLQMEQVTVLNQTPSAFRQLLQVDINQTDADLALRYIIFGGEAMDINALQPWFDKHGFKKTLLINMYGITETTVHVTYLPIRELPDGSSNDRSIGVPIPDLQVYILDPKLKLLPAGAIGEICVGGAGVSNGYLDRPELTASRFVPDPFKKYRSARLYRSGDLGRFLQNGEIEYIGRLDDQIKIRGFRIELGDIESNLKKHPSVRDCIVQVWEPNPDDKRIAAYIVFNPDHLENEDHTENIDSEQVSQWQNVFDATYSQDVLNEDPTLNVIGWNSSYTNEPIPIEQMKDWVQYTVEQILELKPEKILELGCGTGMLLFRLAPYCVQYVGSDLSEVGIQYIKEQMKKPEWNMPQVDLMVRPADNLDGLENQNFDIVVINSVTQLFPSIDYLVKVLEKAEKKVAKGGKIFVGDVRSYSLLETFHTSVQFYNASSNMDCSKISHNIQKAVREENELLIAPSFFYALKQHCPRISNVEIRLKRGAYINEITQFRYDVILYIDDGIVNDNQNIETLDWTKQSFNLDIFKEKLKDLKTDNLIIKNVPNKRLMNDIFISDLIKNSGSSQTKEDLLLVLNNTSEQGVDPEELWQIVKDLNYSIHMGWTDQENDGYFDLALQKIQSSNKGKAFLPEPKVIKRPWYEYANVPSLGSLSRKLVPVLQEYAREHLLAHMVPSAFILLNKLPLTANGKLDRRALPLPDHERPDIGTEYIGPRNSLEALLASIISEVLDIEKVGINDNFFELGGNSLLATQYISRVKSALNIDFPLRELFGSPTIAKLSEVLLPILIQETEDVEVH